MRARSLTTLLLVAACAGSGRSTQETLMSTAPSDSTAPAASCTTLAEVRAHIGQVCTVVGRYELTEIPNQKRRAWRRWPTVILADGVRYVALESVWDEAKAPTAAEIARWRGKTVAVTGKIYGQPPSERPSNLALLTISPVQSITLAE